jgi:hypothetical protein
MSRKTTAWLALLLCLHFVMACATSGVRDAGKGIELSPTASVEARVFPEVRLVTTGGEIHQGKITGLEGGRVRFLPSPYWSVEYEWLDIDTLASISLAKPGGGGGPSILAAFGAGFLITGALGAALSKYDRDYLASLIAGGGTAAISGGIALISALKKPGWRKPLDMTGMTVQQKTIVIMDIMSSGR